MFAHIKAITKQVWQIMTINLDVVMSAGVMPVKKDLMDFIKDDINFICNPKLIFLDLI
jgi:hypothetical protein